VCKPTWQNSQWWAIQDVQWHVLNHFNLKVVIVYYVVNNYSIEWGAPKPRLSNVSIPPNNFQGFGNKLPTFR
jgi:hypothetical protein